VVGHEAVEQEEVLAGEIVLEQAVAVAVAEEAAPLVGVVAVDGRDTEDDVMVGGEDTWTFLYTSGTTGAPKGVMSTHFGIMNTTLASANNQRITEKDRLCLSVPLSHMFG
jgi:long-subunit acyl-CoA synthetase (AMP-forming)